MDDIFFRKKQIPICNYERRPDANVTQPSIEKQVKPLLYFALQGESCLLWDMLLSAVRTCEREPAYLVNAALLG